MRETRNQRTVFSRVGNQTSHACPCTKVGRRRGGAEITVKGRSRAISSRIANFLAVRVAHILENRSPK